MSKLQQITFDELINNILQTHDSIKEYAYKAINVSITIRNWAIGAYIVEYEQSGKDRANYGDHLLANISEKLAQKNLTNISAAELSRFRRFYIVYPQILGTLSQISAKLPKPILGTLSQISTEVENNALSTEKTMLIEPLTLITCLSFSHFAELIKIAEPLKRLFYEVECIKGTWSVRTLRRQISTLLFERTGLSKKPDKLIEITQQNTQLAKPEDIIKSPFTFEFLGLNAKDVVYESDLEQAIMSNIQNFLLEFGNGFCFEARQKKILIEDEYFYIDLVFYHRILHCHILVELKVDEFKHEYMGQLNTYLEYYKRNVMTENDNLPIGILLVTNKNNTLVEYAKGTLDNNIFVSKYLLELPNKEVLQKIINDEIRN